MKKILLTLALLFSIGSSANAATCPTFVRSDRQCDLSTNIVDDYTLNPRGWRMKVPANYNADGTHPLILVFNGSTSAAFPGIGMANTTGLSIKADAISTATPALTPAIIYPDSLFGSRFRIESINGNGTTVTVVTKEVHNLTGAPVANNISISGTTTFDTASVAIATIVDSHTFTYLSATVGSKTVGFIGNTNKSWNNYVQKNVPDTADDLAFINALLAEQLPLLNPDRKQIYCIGWSSGAIFCHHLAIERGDIIAAIGSAEGFTGTTNQYLPQSLTNVDTQVIPSDPHTFSAILFGGTSDTTVNQCANQIRTTFYSRNSSGENPIYLANAMKCTNVPTNLGNNAMCTLGTVVTPSSVSCAGTHSTTGVVVTLTNSTHKAVRASGSWATDGFANTDQMTLLSGFSTTPAASGTTNNGINCRISTITTTTNPNDTITFSTPCNIVDEVTGTGALFQDNLALTFTLPSSPASSFGFSNALPNSGMRFLNLQDPGFVQGDCDISGAVSGSTIKTVATGLCWSNSQAYCTPGSPAVGSLTVQPRPYFLASNNQAKWVANGCADNVDITLYSLLGGGHSIYGGYSNPASQTSLAISAGGSTVTKTGGSSFATDLFGSGDIVGFSTTGGWTLNAGTRCTATVAGSVITLSACSAALVDETLNNATAYVTDNVIDGFNSNFTGAQNQIDAMLAYFGTHIKASRVGYKQEIKGVKQ